MPLKQWQAHHIGNGDRYACDRERLNAAAVLIDGGDDLVAAAFSMRTCGAAGPGAANGFIIICRWHVAPDADSRQVTSPRASNDFVKRRFGTCTRILIRPPRPIVR